MFCAIIQASSGTLERALKKESKGSFNETRGKKEPANKTSKQDVENVMNYIKSYSHYISHYTLKESPDAKYLPQELNLSLMNASVLRHSMRRQPRFSDPNLYPDFNELQDVSKNENENRNTDLKANKQMIKYEKIQKDIEESLTFYQDCHDKKVSDLEKKMINDKKENNLSVKDVNIKRAHRTGIIDNKKPRTIVIRKKDPGLWEIFSAEDIQFWIENGPLKCQNPDYNFKSSKMMYQDRDRYCSKSLLMGKKVNSEMFDREWLIYSPALGCVFCFVCKLFKPSKCALASTGYKDWKKFRGINSGASIQGHKHSSDHRKASLAYIDRKNNKDFLNDQLFNEIRKEKNY
ncbi:zinc finger MYM-type protein 5-like [Hydra vulgaris]|uniref:Zinc finger MYM-type protein 5-like n=1 Tax=Hydra vulgaris TaxID=6087 RepID=A0ABM4BUP8_HYDVU